MRYLEFAQPKKPTQPSGTIKPKPPLTPAQAQRNAERKSGVVRRINDEQQRHGKKMADLRAKMTQT